jgi:hypothetical protein
MTAADDAFNKAHQQATQQQQSTNRGGSKQPPAPPDVWDAVDVLDKRIEPRQWLLGNVFCKGFTSSLVGAGAAGKTAVRIVQGLSVASGMALSGEFVHKRGHVLFLCFEDGKEELERRIKAALLFYRDKLPTELRGWLFCCSITGQKLFTVSGRGLPIPTKLFDWLEEYIEEHTIELIILDPLIKIHATEENDNSGIEQVCARLARLAVEKNVAIDLPHHVRKGAPEPGDADMGRGASAARDAGRLGYTLTPMTPKMAEACGVKEKAMRRSLVRMDSAKVNIAPPTADTIWFRLVGVPLGNSTTQYPNGDNVHTVERWNMPDTYLSDDTINQILDVIDRGLKGPKGEERRYSPAPQSRDRAAWHVVKEFCPDWTDLKCQGLIKHWIEKTDYLFKDDYVDPVDSKKLKGLYVGSRPNRENDMPDAAAAGERGEVRATAQRAAEKQRSVEHSLLEGLRNALKETLLSSAPYTCWRKHAQFAAIGEGEFARGIARLVDKGLVQQHDDGEGHVSYSPSEDEQK